MVPIVWRVERTDVIVRAGLAAVSSQSVRRLSIGSVSYRDVLRNLVQHTRSQEAETREIGLLDRNCPLCSGRTDPCQWRG